MVKCAVVTAGIVLMQGYVAAQTDDREIRTLPEVAITMSTDSMDSAAGPVAVLTAADFQQTTIHSIADLVDQLPGVDLRVRGGGDVQGDLAMRGGSFDQTLILLNGVNLTDAQTGHHNLDIPIDIPMVDRVELLSPAQCLARGIAAFCGAVNIVVSEQYRDRLLAEVSGGSFGTANASLLGTKAVGQWALTAAAAYHRSDGYRHNTDYRHASLFLQAVRHDDSGDWYLQLGGQTKAFGSAGFYSTTYPDQYEATRTLVASVSRLLRLDRFRIRFSAYGRLHRDRFELFRDGWVDSVPAWYGGHNHHLSSVAGLNIRATHPVGAGQMVAGADLRREGIWSNVLGMDDSSLHAPYNHAADRISATLFAGYRLRSGAWGFDATALGVCNSQFGADYGLATELSYRFAPAVLHLAASRTYRLPTFTDLYYQGANQTANPDLGPEHSTTLECKLETTDLPLAEEQSSCRFQLVAYYRAGRGIIDWVRRVETEMWYSMNHTAVDALGFDAQVAFRTKVISARVGYFFCHIMQDADDWISGSALDWLRHSLRASLTTQMAGFQLQLSSSYRMREGQYVDADGQARAYGGTLLFDARLSRPLGPLVLYIEGHNLLNTDWRDHGGVPQPGRTLLAGIRIDM